VSEPVIGSIAARPRRGRHRWVGKRAPVSTREQIAPLSEAADPGPDLFNARERREIARSAARDAAGTNRSGAGLGRGDRVSGATTF